MTDQDAARVKHPWERMPGESTKLFSRFVAYRNAGADRALLTVFNDWRAADATRRQQPVPAPARSPSRNWRDWFHAWNWKERAEAWDMDELQRQEVQFTRDRLANRRNRISTLGLGLGAAAQVIQRLLQVQPGETEIKLGVRDAISLLKVSTDGLRREYGDDVQRHLLGGDPEGDPIEIEIAKLAEAEGIDPATARAEVADIESRLPRRRRS